MDLSINGQSQVPPGFRFHPTEEELLQYYLRKKVSNEKIDLDVIREVDLNKLEPWDIQEKCRIGSAPQNDWYFFSHKDRKYPTGTRTNRATAAGFWKATGRDKMIYGGCRRVGLRKTLVFYKGRAPHGHKSEWIMHEYRLDESNQEQNYLASSVDVNLPEEGWVVCRVFKKKNHQKGPNSPRSTSMPTASMDSKIQKLCSASNQTGVLNRILSYMGRTACKVENEATLYLEHPEKNNNGNSGKDNNSSSSTNKYEFPHDHKAIHQERFILLPRLDSPDSTPPPAISSSSSHFDHFQYLPFEEMMLAEPEPAPSSYVTTTDNSELQSGSHGLIDWAALDQLVASQLNGQDEPTELARQFCCFGDNEDVDLHQLHQIQLNRLNNNQGLQVLGCESDFFWSNFMAKSSSSSSSTDPLRHLSV